MRHTKNLTRLVNTLNINFLLFESDNLISLLETIGGGVWFGTQNAGEKGYVYKSTISSKNSTKDLVNDKHFRANSKNFNVKIFFSAKIEKKRGNF
jgi:hypothetical protein